MSKYRNCCFTSWVEPTFEGMTYLVYGKETCPTTGKVHFQGYCEVPNSLSIKGIQKRLGDMTAHVEKRRGTQAQAVEYCLKDGDFKEFGEKNEQGKRTDIEEVVETLKSGEETLNSVMLNNPSMYCRYRNGLKDITTELTRQKCHDFRHVEVMVLWGDAGSGKTREAIEDSPDYFVLDQADGGTIWFDGYQGQKTLIIDDFYGWIKYGTFLRMLDGYIYRCPVKGGFTYANWTKIFITSNKPPCEWYEKGYTDALKRRITKVEQKLLEHKCY